MYNQYKILTLFLAFAVFFIMPSSSQAQTYEEIVKQMQGNFDDFKKNNEEKFNNFVIQNDKEFSEHLRNAWEQQELLEGKKPKKEKPKPTDTPTIDPIIIEDNEVDELKVVVEKDTTTVENNRPIIPTIEKSEESSFPVFNVETIFFGANVQVQYDQNIALDFSGEISANTIADYWDELSHTNHYTFVRELKTQKTLLNLNDYGYYMFVNDIAQKIAKGNNNQACLLTWFLMLKSGYKARIGYNEKNIYFLLPTNNTIYGKRYYMLDGMKCYLMASNAGSIYTYKGGYSGAKQMVDMNISSPVNLGNKIAVRKVEFNYEGKSYVFDIKYNLNAINFYDKYPQSDIKVFFDAAVANETKVSLSQQLRPIIRDMNELDAANFIINFVQTAFSYKTDDQQFQREKFFFPEEIFYYPHSDCEDRSVLFAYLVKELLYLKVVGVSFPGHMATAINFKGDYGMDNFTVDGDKYVIADPTYINAPVGMCMPQFVNADAKIIHLENRQARKSKEEKLWDLAMKSGCYPGGNDNNIVFDDAGNAYMTGYFEGTVEFDGKTITSKNDKSDIFVAKLDKNGKVIWLKSAGGEGIDMGSVIELDPNGKNCYIGGTYFAPLTINSTTLESNGVKDVFAAKLSTDGTFKWAGKMDIKNPDLNQSHIYVARFDKTGAHKSTTLFEETGHFNSYGIKIDEEDNCFVTVSYSAFDQGAVSTRSYNSSVGYDFVEDWINKNKEMLSDNYVSPIAGLFAFLKSMRVSGTSVTGEQITKALITHNPAIRKIAPLCLSNFSNISLIKNSGGVITISTKDQGDIVFDEVRIKNNAKLKITTYTGGNAQVSVLSGVSLGSTSMPYFLNNVSLIKSSGNLVFDYDDDHAKKTLNLKSDIIR